MKRLLFVLVFLLLCSGLSSACTVTRDPNKHVDRGEIAKYDITVTNTDHPLGVYVRFDIEQDHSRYYITKDEIDLVYMESETVTLWVFTDGTTVDEIHTDVTYLEREPGEEDYPDDGQSTPFTTYINEEQGQDMGGSSSSTEVPPNIFAIGAGGLTLFVVLGSVYHYNQYGTLPLIGGYTRLRKNKLLNNPGRRAIYDILETNQAPMRLTDIRKEGLAQGMDSFRNKSYVHHNLRSLEKFGFVGKKKVDGFVLYYHRGPEFRGGS